MKIEENIKLWAEITNNAINEGRDIPVGDWLDQGETRMNYLRDTLKDIRSYNNISLAIVNILKEINELNPDLLKHLRRTLGEISSGKHGDGIDEIKIAKGFNGIIEQITNHKKD